ncbi:MAG: hypothetical protein AAF986_09935 [Pseudomonadota bacterium]
MLRQIVGMAAGAAAASGGALAEERPFEVLAATLEGRPTWAIVDGNGAAIAVELKGDTTEIIQGVAAGAILSDLRTVAAEFGRSEIYVSSGAAASEVVVDGDVRVGRTSRDETSDIIDSLPHLSEAQRRELRLYLSL